MRAFRDPIVLYPPAEADVLPRDLRDKIQVERMLQLLKTPYPDQIEAATDSEALAYLMSASLEVPLSQDWARIYAHLFGQYMEERNLEIPKELDSLVAECKELDDYYASLLSDLETWIQEQKDKYYKGKQRDGLTGSPLKDVLNVDVDQLLQGL